MKVLVNALSVTNQSGRQVLMGHLNQLREWTLGAHEYLILYHDSNRDLVADQTGFRWLKCPPKTCSWLYRAAWEFRNLNRIAADHHCDFVFTPAGVSVPGIRIPQVVFCQNPWCLVPELHRSVADQFKATLQRRAYRRTMRDASLMVFNSDFMRQAYQDNAGFEAQETMLVYQAISDDTWAAANALGKSLCKPNHILSVSAMAPHKGADILVRAFDLVRRAGIDAKLTFAGGWPDQQHRTEIERMVNQHGLDDQVEFCGWVSDEELHRLYSKAHVFCLLSRCESFGIPAVEAQSFGTPALGTDTCAIPEVGGRGGLYSPVDDVEAAANNLIRVLRDQALWNQLSQSAMENAKRFVWSNCSRPLLEIFERVGKS